MPSQPQFSKENFLRNGALFGHQDQIFLMWGKRSQQEKRPENQWAVSFQNFFSEQSSWISFENNLCLTRSQAKDLFQSMQVNVSWEELNSDSFNKQFQLTQSWIERGRLTKTVPYTFEKAKVQMDSGSIESFISNSLNHEKGFLYGLWDEEAGVLGLTPETLIEQKTATEFSTMALAGTLPLKEFEENPESLTKNKKEIYEHEQVVEFLSQKLSFLGEASKQERSVLKTPHLAHLFTAFDLISEKPVDLVVNQLHPTPALGCQPSTDWKDYLGEFNKIEERGSFGAPFGFSQNLQNSQFVVAIRNITWTKDEISIGAGCGVVAESQQNLEWMELKNKRNSVKRIFGIDE